MGVESTLRRGSRRRRGSYAIERRCTGTPCRSRSTTFVGIICDRTIPAIDRCLPGKGLWSAGAGHGGRDA
jgi:hypothetical protein